MIDKKMLSPLQDLSHRLNKANVLHALGGSGLLYSHGIVFAVKV